MTDIQWITPEIAELSIEEIADQVDLDIAYAGSKEHMAPNDFG